MKKKKLKFTLSNTKIETQQLQITFI